MFIQMSQHVCENLLRLPFIVLVEGVNPARVVVTEIEVSSLSQP